ncbi:concanavalin A-like lectin/glucanase domain-containing protein [Pyronema domesticum]|nr:concanavalin A-like lectin/glucanase domain-containing protein [Pyronema domesticum]
MNSTTTAPRLPPPIGGSVLAASTGPTLQSGQPGGSYPGLIPDLKTGLNSTGPLTGNATDSSAGYKNLLLNAHSGNFFDQFNFFTGPDPTQGLVHYVSKSSASAMGLTGKTKSSVYIGVDSTFELPKDDIGRASVRLEPKQEFTGGLFVLDVEHLPWGCGSWPAFWTFGAPWPFMGEIDIIEGVHLARNNSMVVHVPPGDCSCQLKPFSSSALGASGVPFLANACKPTKVSTETHLKDPRSNSYGGPGYKGGVYAMEWTRGEIKIWFFPRGTEPADRTSAPQAPSAPASPVASSVPVAAVAPPATPSAAPTAPDPSKWGKPVAWIPLTCGWGDQFRNHKVIVNISFCGAWAGQQGVWEASGCYDPDTAPTCEDWVGKRPESFKEAYWKIRSMKVWAPKTSMDQRNGMVSAAAVSAAGYNRNAAGVA